MERIRRNVASAIRGWNVIDQRSRREETPLVRNETRNIVAFAWNKGWRR